MPDQVVIISGGGTGIGKAAAVQFAHAGWRVVVVGRRAALLEATASISDRIFPISADLTNEADLENVIQAATQRWGRIDVVVNNAGSFLQCSLEEFDRHLLTSLFNTNVLAPSLLSKAALPYLKVTEGSIVNISSTFGHKAAPMISHYAASKAALEQLTRCWALELAPYQVRVNAIAPGPTETGILASSGLPAAVIDQIKKNEAERIPLKRRGFAEEVAAWVVRLADPEASWVTGQILAIDGGLSVA